MFGASLRGEGRACRRHSGRLPICASQVVSTAAATYQQSRGQPRQKKILNALFHLWPVRFQSAQSFALTLAGPMGRLQRRWPAGAGCRIIRRLFLCHIIQSCCHQGRGHTQTTLCPAAWSPQENLAPPAHAASVLHLRAESETQNAARSRFAPT